MTDKFSFRRQSLLLTTTPINLTNETSITGFSIGGTEPTDCQRKFLFEVDGKLYKFTGNNIIQVDCDKVIDEVLENGNTAAELLAVTDISTWCGKLIYPIIALDAPASSSVMPTVKFAFKVKSFSDVYQTAEFSPIYELGESARFISVDFEKTVTGGATATLQARLRQDNIWTDWMSLDDAKNKICQAVQLKANYSVTSSSGSSSAQITTAEIFYTRDAGKITSYTSILYLKPEDFSDNLSVCYVLVNHSLLMNCDLKAYVCYDDAPETKSEVLGTGSGLVQNFSVEDGIDFDSLQVQVGGINTFDYTLNTSNKTLSITAPAGEEISISYKYNLAAENWQEMDLQFSMFDSNFNSGSWLSRFVHRLETVDKSKVAKVKVVAQVKQGTQTETFTLKKPETVLKMFYFTKPETISCNRDFIFDAKKNLLKISGNVGDSCTVSYDWQGVPLNFVQIAAGFGL